VDGAGGTHGLIEELTRRRLAYSVGFALPGDPASIQATLDALISGCTGDDLPRP
jgi:hypothetical protein